MCWLASLTFRNLMNPHLRWLGTCWVCAAHLCPASREPWHSGHLPTLHTSSVSGSQTRGFPASRTQHHTMCSLARPQCPHSGWREAREWPRVSTGLHYVLASALCFASSCGCRLRDTHSTDKMEVISWLRIQPTHSNHNLTCKRTAWGATTASLLILNSVYTKHRWHLKTLRKQTFQSTFSSPPCLDGVPASPNSKPAPRKCVMPWEGGSRGCPGSWGWPGKAGAARLCPACLARAGLAHVLPAQATASAASDLLDCSWHVIGCAGGAQGWEILSLTAVLKVLLVASWAEISLLLVFQWSAHFFK